MTDAQLIGALAAVLVVAALLGVVVSVRPRRREASEWTEAARRRRDAKRFNEHVKLLVTFANGLGVAVLVTLAIAPPVGDASFSWRRTLVALLAATMLHMLGQLFLRLWKSEE